LLLVRIWLSLWSIVCLRDLRMLRWFVERWLVE
jgi:hypothetical protein